MAPIMPHDRVALPVGAALAAVGVVCACLQAWPRPVAAGARSTGGGREQVGAAEQGRSRPGSGSDSSSAAAAAISGRARAAKRRRRGEEGEGWFLQRARARLLLARCGICLARGGCAPSQRQVLLRRIATFLPESEIAVALGEGRRQQRWPRCAPSRPCAVYAAALARAGYSVREMWARVGRSRKQGWLSEAAPQLLGGGARRAVRQALIDALLCHRARHDPAASAGAVEPPPHKRRNLTCIIDEPPPRARDPATEFPGAELLPPPPPPPSSSPWPWPAALAPAPASAAAEVPAGRVILIVGPSGVGKSQLLWRWVSALHSAALLRRRPRRHSPPEGGGAEGGGAEAEAARLLCPLTAAHAAELSWDRRRAVVSQFGGGAADPADAAIEWLGAAGLASVPAWCQPHHTLSSGQAFRADLARQLHWAATSAATDAGPVAAASVAAASVAGASVAGASAAAAAGPLGTAAATTTLPLVAIEHFGCKLDRLTAASCAVSLGRALRRAGASSAAGGGLRGIITSETGGYPPSDCLLR